MLVRDQQVTLYRLGFDPGAIDGVFGPHTQAARDAFLDSIDRRGCSARNAETELELARQRLPAFVESKNLTRARRPRSTPIDVIVIHTMEAAEKPKQALAVARWFAGELAPTYPAPQASAHYCVDDQDVVQCVLECDVAWHAPGANHNGIGIEHAGFASQTPAQWDDEYSRAVLAKSAELVKLLCARFNIPIVKLGPGELAAGGRGLCGHVDVTNAFSHGRGHVDPGPSFPWDGYLERIRAA